MTHWKVERSVNNSPSSPTLGTTPAPGLQLDSVETKFQLSGKMKVLEGLGDRVDVWVGYTQQSEWQAYNNRQSNPFRDTTYEPEVMVVVRTDYDLFGLRGRFVNVGFLHQSNGQGGQLSRAWNRVYAQFGFERGGFSLLVRPWYRIRESSAADDDNPDISHYLGYGDLLAVYQWGGHQVSLLLSSNMSARNFHGTARTDWSFPLYGLLRGYLQVFTGYGETLVDYNHAQTTVGAGLLLYNWQ